MIPQTSRFFSNDSILGAHETPKASKRQYDYISQTDHIRSSIDTIMAPMHLPRGSLLMYSNERSDNLLGHSHGDSGVGIRSAASKVSQKRRKSTTNTQTLGQSIAAMTTIKIFSNGREISIFLMDNSQVVSISTQLMLSVATKNHVSCKRPFIVVINPSPMQANNYSWIQE